LDINLSIVHYKSAELFIQLKDANLAVCEDVIAQELLHSSLDQRVQAIQRFALLWRLTAEIGSVVIAPFPRNLFVMLDTLNDEMPTVRLAGRTWLADAISKLDKYESTTTKLFYKEISLFLQEMNSSVILLFLELKCLLIFALFFFKQNFRPATLRFIRSKYS